MTYSLVIPVYRNEENLPRLLPALESLSADLGGELEVIFVVDGSPDRSYEILRKAQGNLGFPSQIILHSRNFGSFAAIRTGLNAAESPYMSVMAADLQEPTSLIVSFFKSLEKGECDIAMGTRVSRKDPILTRVMSGFFWGFYRRFIIKDMPPGGIDIFGCNRAFRDQLVQLQESRSSLVAQLFWLGFRRKTVNYERMERLEGKSSWNWSRKLDYMMDSVFSFTDLPIKVLIRLGALGVSLSLLYALVVVLARLTGFIQIPGYSALVITVLFMGGLNLFGIGLIGVYSWRGYENSKGRPLSVVSVKHRESHKPHKSKKTKGRS